jgi:hypothetical protein
VDPLRLHQVEKLRRHFDAVEKVERVRVERFGLCVGEADIYLASGYRGPTAVR